MAMYNRNLQEKSVDLTCFFIYYMYKKIIYVGCPITTKPIENMFDQPWRDYEYEKADRDINRPFIVYFSL